MTTNSRLAETTSPPLNPHVFVFWNYDTFPFVLGDEGVLLPDGNFKAFSYGGASLSRKSFVAVYPVELGKEINQKLKHITARYRQKIKDVQDECVGEVRDILPEMR